MHPHHLPPPTRLSNDHRGDAYSESYSIPPVVPSCVNKPFPVPQGREPFEFRLATNVRSLIGLVGLAGSGKGTMGNILKEQHGYETTSFAKHLKDVAALAFNLPRSMLEGDTPESRAWREQPLAQHDGRTPREILQLMGTESFRKVFGDDFWVKATMQGINNIAKGYHMGLHAKPFSEEIVDTTVPIVLTDVRFPNEARAIQAAGGMIVRITRGDAPLWWEDALAVQTGLEHGDDMLVTSALDELRGVGVHESEWQQALINPHYRVDNNEIEDWEADLTSKAKHINTLGHEYMLQHRLKTSPVFGDKG